MDGTALGPDAPGQTITINVKFFKSHCVYLINQLSKARLEAVLYLCISMLRGAGEQLLLLVVDGDPSSKPDSGWDISGKSSSKASPTAHNYIAGHWIPAIIAYYSLCSSTLIVINKVAVHNIAVSTCGAPY